MASAAHFFRSRRLYLKQAGAGETRAVSGSGWTLLTLTHSLGQRVIAVAAAAAAAFLLHCFQPLRGPSRPPPNISFLYLPSRSFPAQPFPCHRSIIRRQHPCQISSRASPRIAPLVLAHTVDKLQLVLHQTHFMPAVYVATGFQLCSYGAESLG